MVHGKENLFHLRDRPVHENEPRITFLPLLLFFRLGGKIVALFLISPDEKSREMGAGRKRFPHSGHFENDILVFPCSKTFSPVYASQYIPPLKLAFRPK